MSAEEQKRAIKRIFRGYRGMTNSIEKELNDVGVEVQRTKKHVKMYCDGKMYITATSASDHRAGANIASVICRDISAKENQK